jgi:hypothetical protein
MTIISEDVGGEQKSWKFKVSLGGEAYCRFGDIILAVGVRVGAGGFVLTCLYVCIKAMLGHALRFRSGPNFVF